MNSNCLPIINVLVRTSYRPNYFARCFQSIRQQEHQKNVNVIVSYDDSRATEYIPGSVTQIRVQKTQRTETNDAPWNLYLNNLMAMVKDGWVFILDDDDYLASHFIFSKIASNIMQHDEKTLHVWRMAWPNGRIIPENEYMYKLPFVRKHIGMPCFCFHSSLIKKHGLRFDAKRGGDYRFITELSGILQKINWVNSVFVEIGNTGLVGKNNDLIKN